MDSSNKTTNNKQSGACSWLDESDDEINFPKNFESLQSNNQHEKYYWSDMQQKWLPRQSEASLFKPIKLWAISNNKKKVNAFKIAFKKDSVDQQVESDKSEILSKESALLQTEKSNNTIVRQGDTGKESEMTAHEMAKLNVKETPKIAVLPKRNAKFEFIDYAKNNYQKNSLKEMDSIPLQFAERRRHFFNATQFFKRKGFQGNILSEEGKKFKNEFKKHKYDDTNAERALILYKQHYFPITLKATKYKSLGNKIKVERKFSAVKGREEAKLIVDVSVHTKVHLGLFTLLTSICKHCDSKDVSIHTIKECECILVCCRNCKWVHYTTNNTWLIMKGLSEVTQELVPFDDIIKIDLQTLLFDEPHIDINWAKFETNIDAYEEIMNKYVNNRVEQFCIHTRKDLKKEYLIYCSCGFLGDEHICNSTKNSNKIKNYRNLGEVNFKQNNRVGPVYYTNEYIGIERIIDGEKYILVTYNCERHRGMELYRCNECRSAYNRVLSGDFEAYSKQEGIIRQGEEGSPSDMTKLLDTDFTYEFKEQGGFPSKMMSKICDKGMNLAMDSMIKKAEDHWKKIFGTVPPKSVFYTLASVFAKMKLDTSELTPFKLLEYTQLLGSKAEVRKFIFEYVGEWMPQTIFTLLFGRGSMIFRKKGLVEVDPKGNLVHIISEGFYPYDEYQDIEMNSLKWHEGYTYIKVHNCFKWKDYTFVAQGEFPSFIESIIKMCSIPNSADLLKRLHVINQGTTAFKNISSFISFLIEFLPDIIKRYLVTESELEWRAMCKEGELVDQLNTQLTVCMNAIAHKKQINDAMFLPIEENFATLMNHVLKMGREKAKSFPQAKIMFDEICKLRKNVEEKYMPGEPRDMEPVWFEFVGAAGIGKSSMVKAMIATIDSIPLESVQETLYTRGPTKFYNGYRGQNTIVFDDFNASTVEGESDAQVVEVFLLVSNCEVPLDMASIADKGTQMSAKRVITMGNKFIDISPAIKCGEALNRRKTLSVNISSVGEPNYDDFSHLRFQVLKVDGQSPKTFFGEKRAGLECDDECAKMKQRYGLCTAHGIIQPNLNFFQMCCVMKFKEQRKTSEHKRRSNAQKNQEFENLLKDINFQGGDDCEISEESFKRKLKYYFRRSKCYIKEGVSSIINICFSLLDLLSILVWLVGAVGIPVYFIRKYLNNKITQEEFMQQSEGKTDRKNAKQIRLQGDKSFLERGITRIEFFNELDNWSKSNCLIIGKTVLVNHHMIKFIDGKMTIRILWRDEWKELVIEEKDSRRLRNTAAACKEHLYDANCFYCMNTYTDVTELDLTKFPLSPYKMKANHFYSNMEALPKYLDDITFICKRRSGSNYITTTSYGKGELMTMRNTTGNEQIFFLKTNITTFNGDCGGIYIYKDRILALHFGADTRLGHGLGQVITKEEIGLFFEINPDIKLQGEAERAFNLRNLTFDGVLDTAAHRSTKTELKPSAIYEEFGEATTDTSILSMYDYRANGVDPMVKGVEKYNSDVKILDLDSLEYIQLCTNTFKYDKKPRILSEEEAINGCEDYGLVGLDMSKSAGYGYRPSAHGKRHLFNVSNDYVFSVKDVDLRRRLDELEHSIHNKRVILPISQMTLKDERIKPGKATRTFNNFPVEYTIIARKYLGAFIGCAHSWYRDGKFFSIGINLYSNEANRFITDLLRVSNIVFDGDYKNYDGVLPTVLIYLAYMAISEWYNEFREEIKIIMLWFMHPTVVIEKEVYTQITGNSSGNLMTTLINSIVGYELLYLAYTNLVPPMFQDQNEFCRNTAIKTFGDDNVCAVSRDIVEYYNHARVKDYFKNIGITYTRADKKDVDSEFIYYDDDQIKLRKGDLETLKRYGMKTISANEADIEFLKNTFEFRNFKWYAKLREAVVIEMVYWIRSKSDVWTKNDSVSLESNINTSLRFSYFYGRNYFEEWRRKLYMAVRDKDPNYSYSIVTYMDIHRQIEKFGFIPELDSWSRTSTYEEIRKTL